MHRALAVALVALLLSGCAGRAPKPPASAKHGEFANETLIVGGAKREYRLFVPTTVDLTRPAPLVVAFHAMLIDNKDVMPKYTGLNETAQRHGFLIAYPNAIDAVWGILPDRTAADVAFFDALLKHLSATYLISADRVYVLGMSNGGYFAQLLTRERSDTIAAVASHSGLLGLETLGGINAARKFPVLIVHGTLDLIFPYRLVRDNASKYRREGHEVKYVEVPGLAHAWATEADINEQIWAFFAAHPRARKER